MKKITLLLGSVTFLGMILLFLWSTPDETEVAQVKSQDEPATLNRIPVAKEEMHLIMQLSGRAAAGEMDPEHSEEAMDRLLEIKVAQQLAVKYGILKDSSFSAFLKEFDLENKRRAKALTNKEVIYGPRQYSQLTYYDYRHANMINSLKSKWSEQELDISDDKLMDYFEQNRDRFAKKHDKITIYKIMQPKATTEAEQKMRWIEQELKAGQAFMKLYHQLEGDGGFTEIETINEENYREVSKYHSGFYHLVTNLSPGEVSEVLEDEKQYFVVMIADKHAEGFKNFEEIREEVIRHYTDDYFQSFLTQQMALSEVKIKGVNVNDN